MIPFKYPEDPDMQAAYEDGYNAGAMTARAKEREAVVYWLRAKTSGAISDMFIEAIKRGQHIRVKG